MVTASQGARSEVVDTLGRWHLRGQHRLCPPPLFLSQGGWGSAWVLPGAKELNHLGVRAAPQQRGTHDVLVPSGGS